MTIGGKVIEIGIRKVFTFFFRALFCGKALMIFRMFFSCMAKPFDISFSDGVRLCPIAIPQSNAAERA